MSSTSSPSNSSGSAQNNTATISAPLHHGLTSSASSSSPSSLSAQAITSFVQPVMSSLLSSPSIRWTIPVSFLAGISVCSLWRWMRRKAWHPNQLLYHQTYSLLYRQCLDSWLEFDIEHRGWLDRNESFACLAHTLKQLRRNESLTALVRSLVPDDVSFSQDINVLNEFGSILADAFTYSHKVDSSSPSSLTSTPSVSRKSSFSPLATNSATSAASSATFSTASTASTSSSLSSSSSTTLPSSSLILNHNLAQEYVLLLDHLHARPSNVQSLSTLPASLLCTTTPTYYSSTTSSQTNTRKTSAAQTPTPLTPPLHAVNHFHAPTHTQAQNSQSVGEHLDKLEHTSSTLSAPTHSHSHSTHSTQGTLLHKLQQQPSMKKLNQFQEAYSSNSASTSSSSSSSSSLPTHIDAGVTYVYEYEWVSVLALWLERRIQVAVTRAYLHPH